MGSQGGFPGGFSGLKPTGLTGSCVTFPFFFFSFFSFFAAVVRIWAVNQRWWALRRGPHDASYRPAGQQCFRASRFLQARRERSNSGTIREQFGMRGGVFLLVFGSASPDVCGFGHVAGRHFLLLFPIFFFAFLFLSFLLVNGGSKTPGRLDWLTGLTKGPVRRLCLPRTPRAKDSGLLLGGRLGVGCIRTC